MSSSPPQPRIIRYLYSSALLIQSVDTYLFYTVSPVLFPNQLDFQNSLAARFFLRASANPLLPFALNGWLLRDYHIRHTRVGRVVGSCFAMFHGAAVAMYSWSRWMPGEYSVEPFWGIVGLHAMWTGVAVWGLFFA